MMANCSYAKRLWQLVGQSNNKQGLSITRRMVDIDDQKQGKWHKNLWKERCRRVFDNKARSTQELLQDIINDVQMQRLAFEDNQ